MKSSVNRGISTSGTKTNLWDAAGLKSTGMWTDSYSVTCVDTCRQQRVSSLKWFTQNRRCVPTALCFLSTVCVCVCVCVCVSFLLRLWFVFFGSKFFNGDSDILFLPRRTVGIKQRVCLQSRLPLLNTQCCDVAALSRGSHVLITLPPFTWDETFWIH